MLARAFGLAGRELPLSIWLPSVLVWHDVAVALAFWAAASCLPGRVRPWLATAIYWVVVAWAALNVAVVRALSSPLTLPMLRAADGPLSDSIAHYATPGNLAMMLAVIAAGAFLPRLRVPPRAGRAVAAGLVAVALPGPFVESQVDTRGAQQNAVTALARSAFRRTPSVVTAGAIDWRLSPFTGAPASDLSRLHGSAAGRNVVLIALESTAARYLHTYGAIDDPMPGLTALARRALQFDSTYAVYPESIKGLVAVLCSRHPAFDVAVEVHAAAPCVPLAGTLAAAGYQTGLFHSGRFAYLGMKAVVGQQAFEVSEDAAAIGGLVESSFGVDEQSAVARILTWIDRRDQSRPFFVAYLPVAGHHPYAVPDPGPFSGEGDLSAYKNALRYADRSVAELLAGLRSRGLDERTIVVVYGDHGEAFGQHDGNVGHTLFAFDENVRVPLLISIPGVTVDAMRAPQVASVVDIAPTLLDLLGLDAPSSFEGSSLLVGTSRIAYVFTDYALGWVGLRDGCWKYLLEIDARRSHLFDVCVDPGESFNHAAEQPARVEAYRDRALGWLNATRRGYRAGR
jgi:hypothetical protein